MTQLVTHPENLVVGRLYDVHYLRRDGLDGGRIRIRFERFGQVQRRLTIVGSNAATGRRIILWPLVKRVEEVGQ